MTPVVPFHTNNPEYPPTHRSVFHDNSECEHGRAIKREHRVPGTGDRERCDRCSALESKAHRPPVMRLLSMPFRVLGKLVTRLGRSSN